MQIINDISDSVSNHRQVTVISSQAVDAAKLPPTAQVMSPQLLACAGAQLGLDACSDAWRCAYVELLTNCVYANSAQVTSLLGHFMYRREKLVRDVESPSSMVMPTVLQGEAGERCGTSYDLA